MKKLILSIVLLIGFAAGAQNVYISGRGKDIKGKTIRLYSLADGISNLQCLEQEQILSQEDTSFSFAITLPEERIVLLKMDLIRYSFIAKPGVKYHLDIKDFNFSYDDSLYAYSFGMVLPCELTMEHFDGINLPVEDVDNNLDNFLFDNQRLLYVKDSAVVSKFYLLRDSLLDKYKDNDYISNYITYEFAGIEYGLSLKGRRGIKETLFTHKPILYSNIGYMNCFTNLFSKYFSKGYKYINRSDIEYWLSTNNLNAFNDALGRDKLLENEVFRELVFLQGMKDAYLDGYFDKGLIKKMLVKFAETTKFNQHKTIAQNLIKFLSDINAQSNDVGQLMVVDIDSNKKTISSYIDDKPLIVCFVRLDQEESLKELEAIHFCYDSIKNNMNVLTICCANNFERMYNFIKNNKVGNKYKWDFVYFDQNYDLIEKFHIRTFPSFVLVDKQGKIEKNPIDAPSTGVLLNYNKQNNQ